MPRSRSARTQAFVDRLTSLPFWRRTDPRPLPAFSTTSPNCGTGWGMALEGLGDPKDYLLITLILYFAETSADRGAVTGGVGDCFLLSALAGDHGVSVDLTRASTQR